MSFSEMQIIAKSSKGHVNNVTYLEYLETARKPFYAYCISIGVEGMIGHISADYKKEVHNNDVLTVRTVIEKVGNTSVTLNQSIVTNKNELVVSATVILVTVNRETRQKVTVPQAIRDLVNERTLAKMV